MSEAALVVLERPASCERIPAIAMDLFAESLAVFQRLEAEGIEYAVVGAFAVAFHGVPRAMTDIDILVRPEAVEPAI
ncbi:MAG: hypothetical protein IT186_24310 [Acidobacteria bacterium]|nr:hypothetical protein [Acidobacteriota bacterium]